MEAQTKTDPRFIREAPHLTEAPEPSDLLSRLERYAEDAGRLHGRIDALEDALRAERATRRRLAETIRRERVAARALADRMKRAEAANKAARAENERLQRAVETSEHALQAAWAHNAQVESQLAWAQRPAWRKLMRRPPRSA